MSVLEDRRAEVEAEWLGQTDVEYERGGPGDRRHPKVKRYTGCTVKEVIWPGSVITNADGRWVAFRLKLRTGDGRQITTMAMPSPIPAGS